MKRLKDYRTYGYISIVILALGVVFNANGEGAYGTLGKVLVALGGLFLIIAMKKKHDLDSAEQTKDQE